MFLMQSCPTANRSSPYTYTAFIITGHQLLFNSFRELATLTYGEQTNNCCIVSSIEFVRDGEFFAVAGVTKKIKVFEYQSVVRNAGFTNHFPVHEMPSSVVAVVRFY